MISKCGMCWLLSYIVVVIGNYETVKLEANQASHTLLCIGTGEDNYQWFYYKSNEADATVLKDSSHYSVSNYLIISNITSEVEGYYYCEVDEIKQDTIRILVLGIPVVTVYGTCSYNITNISITIAFVGTGPANEVVTISLVQLKHGSTQIISYYNDSNSIMCYKSDSVLSCTNSGWSNLLVSIGGDTIKQYGLSLTYEGKKIEQNVSISSIAATSTTVVAPTLPTVGSSTTIDLTPTTISPTVSSVSYTISTMVTPTTSNIITTSSTSDSTPSIDYTPTIAPLPEKGIEQADDAVFHCFVSETIDSSQVIVIVPIAVVLILIIVMVTIISMLVCYRKHPLKTKQKKIDVSTGSSSSSELTTTPTSQDKQALSSSVYDYIAPVSNTNPSTYCDLISINLPPQAGTKIVQV